MGQNVSAVIYGVFPNKKLDSALEKMKNEIGDWKVSPPKGVGVFETLTGDDKVVFGIPVAVSNVPEDDEAEFPECRVVDLAKVLHKHIAAAKKRWKLLEQWASKQNVNLGTPDLLLCSVERA